MSVDRSVRHNFTGALLRLLLLGSAMGPAQAALPPPQSPATKPLPPPPASHQGPQAFDFLVGEQASFGFAASQPGPISVTVTWQGAPLLVTLVKPGGGTLERQGSGSVMLAYTATAEDVRQGVLWNVNLRSPQPAPPTVSPVHVKPVKQQPQLLARGTIALHHPPADPSLVQAALKARQAKVAKPSPQAASGAPSLLAQKQAILQKQQATRQTQLLDQVRSKIPAEVHLKMSQRIATAAAQPLPGAKVLGTALPAAPPPVPGSAGTKATSVPPAPKSNKDGPPAGTSNPVIAALSISAGQPGDPVLITGSGFSGTAGEVHFIVANGRDLVAPISGWNDGQIFAAVPDVSGLQAFNGQVYVRRGGADSSFVPFQFSPALEYRSLDVTNDRIITGAGTFQDYRNSGIGIDHDGSGNFFGDRGEDQYFLVARLRNGWVVDSAYLSNDLNHTTGPWIFGHASAYITEYRGGTDSPYLKVRWWYDGFSDVNYRPNLIIRGPRGVPHQ